MDRFPPPAYAHAGAEITHTSYGCSVLDNTMFDIDITSFTITWIISMFFIFCTLASLTDYAYRWQDVFIRSAQLATAIAIVLNA